MSLTEFTKTRQDQNERLSQISRACRDLLISHPEYKYAREYISGRLNETFQERYQIGYFPEDKDLGMLFKHVPIEVCMEAGLVYQRECLVRGNQSVTTSSILNKHNLIIPFKDEYGEIISLVGRTLLNEEDRKLQGLQKYKYTPVFRGLHLFGLHQAKPAIRRKNAAVIVEGQFDAISCQARGIHNTIALGGTTLNKYHIYLIKKFASKLYLLLDNDQAGGIGTQKIINKFADSIDIEVVNLPSEYKDIDKYLQERENYNELNVLF